MGAKDPEALAEADGEAGRGMIRAKGAGQIMGARAGPCPSDSLKASQACDSPPRGDGGAAERMLLSSWNGLSLLDSPVERKLDSHTNAHGRRAALFCARTHWKSRLRVTSPCSIGVWSTSVRATRWRTSPWRCQMP